MPLGLLGVAYVEDRKVVQAAGQLLVQDLVKGAHRLDGARGHGLHQGKQARERDARLRR